MSSFNQYAVIPPANRNFAAVKKVVEHFFKQPAHKPVILALGGVQAVAVAIFGVISKTFNPAGAIVQSILAIFATVLALGGLAGKVRGTIEKIVAKLTELPLKV
jgi:hypothetical protein